MDNMDEVKNNLSFKDKIKNVLKNKFVKYGLIVGGIAGFSALVITIPVIVAFILGGALFVVGVSGILVGLMTALSETRGMKKENKKKILDFDELAKKAELKLQKEKEKQARIEKKKIRKEKRKERFENIVYAFVHNLSIRIPTYILMFSLGLILHLPFISMFTLCGMIGQAEEGSYEYRTKEEREKKNNKEEYVARGKYDEKFINFCKNIPNKAKNFVNKLSKEFSKATRSQKFGMAMLAETILYSILMFATGSDIVLFSFLISIVSTFGVDFGLDIRDSVKKQNEKLNKKLEEEKNNEQSAQKELAKQVKLINEINDVKELPTIGSIIRSSKEIFDIIRISKIMGGVLC